MVLERGYIGDVHLSFNNNCQNSSPDLRPTKQDMFDLTILKLHTMNRPARRDSSLRKSVLIFNLFRCLQRENSFDEMVCGEEDSISNAARRSSSYGSISSYSDDDDDEQMTDGNDLLDSEEIRLAVNSLVDIDQERHFDQLSHSNENSWISSCGTAEPESMDVDQPDDSLLDTTDSPCSENVIRERQSTDIGLISETSRLLDDGNLASNGDYPFICNKSFGISTNNQSEYRPFDESSGFNLFA